MFRGRAHLRAQMWSVPKLYPSSVTQSRSFFLSCPASLSRLPHRLCSWYRVRHRSCREM